MKRMTRSRVVAAVLVVLVAGGLAWTGCRQATQSGSPAAQAPAAKYHCPMHPTVVSDKPGDCPICGMALVPIEPAAAPATAPAAQAGQPTPAAVGRRILFYRSPMDPNVRSDKPSQDSMGMDFLPVYEDETAPSAGAVAGRSVVSLTPERRSLLGVRSEVVRQMRIEKSLRTVGRVTPDERRLAHFHTRFEGTVEHLYVDYTNMYVKKGDPLLSIYSPELVATQQEYLLALRALKQLGSSPIPSVAQGSADLLEAARQRLLQWDIRPQDIAEVERTGTVKRTFDLYAEVGGYVLQKNVVQGMRVMPTDTLFDLVDLSQVWVLADVYESDLQAVRLGMPASVTLAFLPGKTWRGTVTNIAPTVEEKTRTIKVRIDVDNAAGTLKPDMYADVQLRTDMGMGLVVPDSAIIDTGDRKLVFLDRPDGAIEPREVEVGVRIPDGYQVLRGLAQGDRVVTAANFLLDSESSLKAALSAFTAPSAPAREKR
jgi:multidrug efflux pump subunit AcrA (membrane-fusion protein)